MPSSSRRFHLWQNFHFQFVTVSTAMCSSYVCVRSHVNNTLSKQWLIKTGGPSTLSHPRAMICSGMHGAPHTHTHTSRVPQRDEYTHTHTDSMRNIHAHTRTQTAAGCAHLAPRLAPWEKRASPRNRVSWAHIRHDTGMVTRSCKYWTNLYMAGDVEQKKAFTLRVGCVCVCARYASHARAWSELFCSSQ